MKLALTMKFNPNIHGIYSYEHKYLKYMRHKHFVMETIDLWAEGENIIDIINWYTQQRIFDLQLSIIKTDYKFLGRDFAIISSCLINFQKKYKKYYKNKMAYYKNPRNLRKRELQGYFSQYRV